MLNNLANCLYLVGKKNTQFITKAATINEGGKVSLTRCKVTEVSDPSLVIPQVKLSILQWVSPETFAFAS